MTNEVFNYIESLKTQVTNSAVDAKTKVDICRYFGRALNKKQSENDCKQFLTKVNWPGANDAQALSNWWSFRETEKNNGTKSQKKAKAQEKPLSADDALTLLQTLADIQGLTVADLTKQLDSQKKEMAKKHHGELLQKYYEANEALQKYKDEWAEVINEYYRLNDVCEKAGREAQQFAETYNIK